jgi:hypothetical protein
MEVSVGCARVLPPVLDGIELLHSLEGDLVDVVEGTPAVEDLVGLDVNFVEKRIGYPAVLGAADCAEVRTGDVVSGG